jgi:NAD(P)-dependent dehydrogenase (short-subunit alcohol dehydrogenase family)
LDLSEMQKVFAVNTFGVGLVIKHLLPAMRQGERSVFASLSARVGSIEDNRLGGWYSYRASKAAQNMLVKTAAIEARLKTPELICVQLHPGTVDSELSAPFTKRLPNRHKVFTPAFACERLCDVLGGLSRQDSGHFFAWDGKPVSW